jgi:hypothetical protein
MSFLKTLAAAAAFLAPTGVAFGGNCNGKAGWHLDVSPDMPPIGGSVTFTMTGPANEMGALMFSTGQGPNDTSYGTVCLDFPLLYITFFTFDANGNGTVTADVPCDFNLRCLDFYCQFITCSPNKGISNQNVVFVNDAICADGWMISYTQDEWSTASDGAGNIGHRRDAFFGTIFPSGVTIGDTTLDGSANGYALTFTSSAAIVAFLPQSGACGVLNGDASDPTTSSGGALAGELLAAKLNVAFDDAAAFNDLKFRTDVLLGDLELGGSAPVAAKLLGMTGRALISLSDQAVSGALGSGPFDVDGDSIGDVTVDDLCNALSTFNSAFDNGHPAGNLVFP